MKFFLEMANNHIYIYISYIYFLFLYIYMYICVYIFFIFYPGTQIGPNSWEISVLQRKALKLSFSSHTLGLES